MPRTLTDQHSHKILDSPVNCSLKTKSGGPAAAELLREVAIDRLVEVSYARFLILAERDCALGRSA
jgi:hypothetical protein